MSEGEQGRRMFLIGHHFELKQHNWILSKATVPIVQNRLKNQHFSERS
jgi:hypothetical protein